MLKSTPAIWLGASRLGQTTLTLLDLWRWGRCCHSCAELHRLCACQHGGWLGSPCFHRSPVPIPGARTTDRPGWLSNCRGKKGRTVPSFHTALPYSAQRWVPEKGAEWPPVAPASPNARFPASGGGRVTEGPVWVSPPGSPQAAPRHPTLP